MLKKSTHYIMACTLTKGMFENNMLNNIVTIYAKRKNWRNQ